MRDWLAGPARPGRSTRSSTAGADGRGPARAPAAARRDSATFLFDCRAARAVRRRRSWRRGGGPTTSSGRCTSCRTRWPRGSPPSTASTGPGSWSGTRPRLTRLERLRLQESARSRVADIAVDLAGMPLTRLALVRAVAARAERVRRRAELTAALRAAARRAAGRRAGSWGRVVGGARRQLLLLRLAAQATPAAGGRAGRPLPAGGLAADYTGLWLAHQAATRCWSARSGPTRLGAADPRRARDAARPARHRLRRLGQRAAGAGGRGAAGVARAAGPRPARRRSCTSTRCTTRRASTYVGSRLACPRSASATPRICAALVELAQFADRPRRPRRAAAYLARPGRPLPGARMTATWTRLDRPATHAGPAQAGAASGWCRWCATSRSPTCGCTPGCTARTTRPWRSWPAGPAYVAYVPHAFVAELDRRRQARPRRTAPSCASRPAGRSAGVALRFHRRMARREDRNRLRFLPLHLALEGYLALHFGGPRSPGRSGPSGRSPRACRRGSRRPTPAPRSPASTTRCGSSRSTPASAACSCTLADALAARLRRAAPGRLPGPAPDAAAGPVRRADLPVRPAVPGRAGLPPPLDADRVPRVADLRAEAARAAADWAAFHDDAWPTGLLGDDRTRGTVYRMGRFTLCPVPARLRPARREPHRRGRSPTRPGSWRT